MGDVKWIKIATGMFDNRKIKQIRKLPEGDAIIVIWLQIICLAGITNDSGLIYFSKDIPYTDEMLSVEFDRPINIIRIALTTFERFGMVELIDNVLMVSNWQKYQSTDRLEAIKEKDRERKRLERQQQKQLTTLISTEIPRNVHGLSKEVPLLDIDIEKDINTIGQKTDQASELFNQFWINYPRHVSKSSAEKAFKKLKVTETILEKMLHSLEVQKQSRQWSDKQYIPHPATWLNQKRWEDEADEPQNGAKLVSLGDGSFKLE